MKLILFGANGQTGTKVIEQAIQEGIEITAFVRRADSIQLVHENLTVIVGDALNYKDVKQAMEGQDTVISCIGGPGTKVSTTITDITKNVVEAMNETGVKRIVQVASAGIHGELSGVIGKMISFMLKNTLNDHKGAFEQLQKSGVDYTVARPVSLTSGELKGIYRESEDGVPEKGMNISRADVADFLLKAVQDDHYIRKSVGLAY